MWVGHVKACSRRLGGGEAMVPGRRIYTHGDSGWGIWEVDGEVDRVSFLWQDLKYDLGNWANWETAVLPEFVSLREALSGQQVRLFRRHWLPILSPRAHLSHHRRATSRRLLQQGKDVLGQQ